MEAIILKTAIINVTRSELDDENRKQNEFRKLQSSPINWVLRPRSFPDVFSIGRLPD